MGYNLMTGDVIHLRILTPGELPEHIMLGEVCFTVQLYYRFHTLNFYILTFSHFYIFKMN